MCKNLRPFPKTSAVVYKIIARRPKGTRYYSVAMGFKYPKKGKIPKIKIQNSLGYYASDILNPRSFGHERKMIGRTAGFKTLAAAKLNMNIIDPSKFKNHRICVVKVKLTDDLMIGDYGTSVVIAGRHIEFL